MPAWLAQGDAPSHRLLSVCRGPGVLETLRPWLCLAEGDRGCGDMQIRVACGDVLGWVGGLLSYRDGVEHRFIEA